MYQTVGHQVIELFAEAMDLPLYRRTIQGSSLETSRNYRKTEGDEVEDLYELLHLVKVGISSPHYLLLSWQCEWILPVFWVSAQVLGSKGLKEFIHFHNKFLTQVM